MGSTTDGSNPKVSKTHVVTTLWVTALGTGLIAYGLSLGYNGVLLTGWLVILGGIGGYEYCNIKTSTLSLPSQNKEKGP